MSLSPGGKLDHYEVLATLGASGMGWRDAIRTACPRAAARRSHIARILEREPDWSALPANTSPRVRERLCRCVRKDPKQRPRDIGDARQVLATAYVLAEPPVATGTR